VLGTHWAAGTEARVERVLAAALAAETAPDGGAAGRSSAL
jgi:hypothetical protein